METSFETGPEHLADLHERIQANQSLEFPLTFEDVRAKLRETVDDDAYGFLTSGAGAGVTKENNVRSFEQWEILPRVLRDVSDRNMSVTLFDKTYPTPLLFSPIGGQSLVADDGEVATGRVASELGVPMVLSSASSRPMEDVAEAAENARLWYQLYLSENQNLNDSLLDRAIEAGYEAIVVTVDQPIRGWRPTEMRHGFTPTRLGQFKGNYFTDPAFLEELDVSPEEDPSEATRYFRDIYTNPAIDWEDIADVQAKTDLPVLVKGIMHPTDAELAVDAGVDGIVLSNHGGNHIDGAASPIDLLPEIKEVAGETTPVLFDSGVRSGTDVFKAIALGADGVCVGRPYLYALAVGGEEGAQLMVENILAEFDITMGNVGCRDIDDIDPSLITAAD